MKRLILIFLAVAVVLSVNCSIFAQSRRENCIKFSKSYDVPGMTRNELYSYLAGWNIGIKCLDVGGGVLVGKDPREIKSYSGFFEDLDFDKTRGDLYIVLYLKLRDNGFDMEMTDISVYWRHKMVLFLYPIDDRFNRPALWRLFHSKRIIDAARARSAELFEELTAAMDEYLKAGPPIDMKKL